MFLSLSLSVSLFLSLSLSGYIYIYIFIYRQTVSLWLGPLDASRRKRATGWLYVGHILHQTNINLYVSEGIFFFFCMHACILLATGGPNSWEERCIWVYEATGKFSACVLNPRSGSIYFHPQTLCFVGSSNSKDRWKKGCILPFPKKGDLGLAKNYRSITVTSIAAKTYNALLRNRIEPNIDNILGKNQNGFQRNRSTTSQILTIRRILEGVRAKNLLGTLLFVDFTKTFDSILRGKME